MRLWKAKEQMYCIIMLLVCYLLYVRLQRAV